MSLPLTPFERWQEGTTQPRLPVNDNSLRAEIAMTNGIANDVTAQPGSPDDGDWYIIPAGATGTQWATFAEDSIAIFYGGTWYEFVPAQGNRIMVAGVFYIFDGSDGWEAVTIPATSAAEDVTYDNTTSGLSATDVQAAIDELASAPGGGASTTQPDECISGLIVTPADGDYRIVVNAPHGGTITNVTTISASGSCTLTVKINTTPLGGTANSVSTSEQSQAHASSNTFAAGDDIVLTVSSNSACSKMTFTIKYTRTLA